MNLILSIISIFICFSTVLLIGKLFKKEGLYVWLAIASIIANIIVCKNISINGICFTLGNILFASNFLATDILSENYSKKESIRGVYLALFSVIVFIVATQIALLFVPDASDICNTAMKQLFSINFRTCIASVLMFFISNLADVYLYDKLKKQIPNKLWLRNNISTIISNCTENFFFVFIAFLGIYDFQTILSIAITTSIAEILIAICDTPFIYLAKKLKI